MLNLVDRRLKDLLQMAPNEFFFVEEAEVAIKDHILLI